MNKLKKLAIGTLLSTTVLYPATSHAAKCFVVDSRFKAYANSKFLRANRNIVRQLQGMDMAVKRANDTGTEAIAAAVFVLTSQKAAGTQQVAKAIKNNTQIQANAMSAVNKSRRMRKVIRDYGSSGLGYRACQVLKKRESIQEVNKATRKAIKEMVNTEITARAGRYANRREAMATRLALHDKYYCTEGQAQAGLCSGAGSRAGRSLQASTLFEPADFLSLEYNDKSALINNMVGLPDDPVPTSQASSQAGLAYADTKRRKDAIKSTAMTALKSIQASWSTLPLTPHRSDKAVSAPSEASGTRTEDEQLAKDGVPTREETKATGEITTTDDKKADDNPEKDSNDANDPVGNQKNASLMVRIKKDVERYLGGGEEYKQWSKTLTGQEEKGVLTEILKVKALRLYVQVEQYKQLQQMEAMLAANVSAELQNSGMEQRVQRLRAVAQAQALRDSVTQPNTTVQ